MISSYYEGKEVQYIQTVKCFFEQYSTEKLKII